jgi:hypothetical protein
VNRDPLDSLRARNPLPPESLPDAPMAVAGAITTGRPSWQRGLAVAGVAAAVVLAGGGSWLAWSRAPGRDTAAPVSPTTAAPAGTVLPVGAGTEDVPTAIVYFLDAETSTLVPVARDLKVLNVRPLPNLPGLTLQLLLFGPGAWDAAPLPEPVAAAEALLTSAIPDGTQLLGLEVTGGIAMVDLSEEFAAASPEAVAQVVFTATRLDGIAGVRFLIEGQPQWIVTETLAPAPPDSLPAGTAYLDPVTRSAFGAFVPLLLAESPVLGEIVDLPALIGGSTGAAGAGVLIQLVAEDEALLWSGTAEVPCRGCPAGHFAVEVPSSAARGTGWATLRFYLSTLDRGPLAQYPVWLVPEVAPADEPNIPEATTSTVGTYAAPWSAEPLPAEAVPTVARETWAAAENAAECALLFPADPAALAGGAVLHDRYFGGGWGLAWDLPSGLGRWEPGGEYCANCGREAFGVAGTGGDWTGQEDQIWPHRLQWTYGAEPGPVYSHAGYGYEGLTAGEAGEPVLAYLFIDHQDCLYNVWSFLGEEHLLTLIEQLRFVEGAGAL